MKQRIYTFVMVLIPFLFNTPIFAEDFVFSTDTEINTFLDTYGASPSKIEVGNLTLTGNLSKAKINALSDVISAVNGTLRVENLTGTPTEWFDPWEFFINVEKRGSIIVRNTNINNLAGNDGSENPSYYKRTLPEVVHGDFIWEDNANICPGVNDWNHWTNFGQVFEVEGNYSLKLNMHKYEFSFYDRISFKNLRKVGGDFKVDFTTSGQRVWTMDGSNLTEVGGDLIFIGPGNNAATVGRGMWNLNLFKNLEYIGGNVRIVDFPMIELGASSDQNEGDGLGYGYCWIRNLIDTEVINYACKDVYLGYTGDPIDLATLGGCFDGITPDTQPQPLPAKDPDCGASGIKEVVKSVFATVYPTYAADGYLTIESQTGLSKVELFDMASKCLWTQYNLAAGKNSVPVSTLTRGVYLLKLTSVNNDVAVSKIIK